MIFIISGKRHSGKTALVKSTLEILKKNRVPVRGFQGEAILDGDWVTGYDLINIATGRRHALLREKLKTGGRKTGRYEYAKGIKPVAAKIIKDAHKKGLIVIDELGPAEIDDKKGLWPAVRKAFTGENEVLVVTRESLLRKFLSLVEGIESETFHAGANSSYEVAQAIKKRFN